MNSSHGGDASHNDAFQDHYPDDLAMCFGCGRLNEHGHRFRTVWDGEQTLTRFTPGPDQTAIPGYVYGGLIASLIDCSGTGSAAGAAYRAAGRTMGDPDDEPPLRFVTGRLEVDFLAPTPMGVELLARGEIEQISARKVITRLAVHAGDVVVARGRVVAVLMPGSMGA